MIYIRADMNMQIATGHMMRCLSIADALSSMEKSVTFILADDKALSLLKQRGYYAIVLHTDWNNMEGELPALRKVITENQIDKMLIDSYQVTEKYLKELSRFVKIDLPYSSRACHTMLWILPAYIPQSSPAFRTGGYGKHHAPQYHVLPFPYGNMGNNWSVYMEASPHR